MGVQTESGGVKFDQQVSEREELREKLDDLEEKYRKAINDCQNLLFELEDLDKLRVMLEQAARYLCEVEKLDLTLSGVARELNVAGKDPDEYYGVFLQLLRYMETLKLFWR